MLRSRSITILKLVIQRCSDPVTAEATGLIVLDSLK